MIDYTPDKWQVRFLFQLRGSIFPKATAWALPSTVLAILLHQFVITRDHDMNMSQFGAYNFVLGFLVVFRSQQAYSRFWEAGTILQQVRGNWFNAMSACSSFCSYKPQDAARVLNFKHCLFRLASLLFCSALQQIAVLEDESFEIISLDGFDEDTLRCLSDSSEKTTVILQWMQQLIVRGHHDGTLDVPPPILSRVFQELSNGIVGISDAQKISDILFPFPLAQMVSTMLVVSTVITPTVLATTMENPVWCGTLNFICVFCYWCINYIAAEIEMPFGDDANDLPLHELQKSLNTALLQLLDPQLTTVPSFHLTDQNKFCPTVACPSYLVDAETGYQPKVFQEDTGEAGPQAKLTPRQRKKRRARRRLSTGSVYDRQTSGGSIVSGASGASSAASSVGSSTGRGGSSTGRGGSSTGRGKPNAHSEASGEPDLISSSQGREKTVQGEKKALRLAASNKPTGDQFTDIVVAVPQEQDPLPSVDQGPIDSTCHTSSRSALRDLIECARKESEDQLSKAPSRQGQSAFISRILAYVFLMIDELDRHGSTAATFILETVDHPDDHAIRV